MGAGGVRDDKYWHTYARQAVIPIFFAIFGQLRLLTLSDFIPSLLAASSYVMKITSDSELIRSSVRILSGL